MIPYELAALLLGQVLTAAGIYAAIRADLADLKAHQTMSTRRIERLEDRTAL